MKISFFASLLVLMSVAGLAHADLVADSFDYGDQPAFLGPQHNGGTGFSEAWQWGSGAVGGLAYSPNGLDFGSFATSGGSALANNSRTAFRSFATSFSPNDNPVGFGSYLFKLTTLPQSLTTFLRMENSYAGDPRWLAFNNLPNQDSLTSRIHSLDTFNNQSFSENVGASLALNTTYMQLFTFDLTPNANVAQSWILNLNQYEQLAQGGITVGELNARGIGQGNNDVIQKLSLTGDFTDNFLRLNIGADNFAVGGPSISAYFDEIRVSNQSFNQALGIAAVPEPSSMLLMSVVAAGAGFLKRRKLFRA